MCWRSPGCCTWCAARWAFSARSCKRTRRWRTATGWKSIARWQWIRKRRDAPAPLLTPVVHGALGPLDLLRALLVVDKDPLAVGVGRRDALPALQAAQRSLRLLAVHALTFRVGALLGGLFVFFLPFLLALSERGLWAEVLRSVLFRRGDRCRWTRRRLERRRLRAGRRRIAVAHLAVLVDPPVLLGQGSGCKRDADSAEQCLCHRCINA